MPHTLNEAVREDPVQNTSAINADDTPVLNNNPSASKDKNNVNMEYVAIKLYHPRKSLTLSRI